MKMRASWMILACMLPLTVANAQHDFSVSVHLASQHIGTAEEYNEKNLGMGVERNNWTAGFYKNSLSNHSLYLGRVFEINDYAGIKAGVVTGYESGLSAMVVAYVRIQYVEIMLIPPNPKSPTTVGFSLRF